METECVCVWGVTVNENKISLGIMEDIVESDSGDGYTPLQVYKSHTYIHCSFYVSYY